MANRGSDSKTYGEINSQEGRQTGEPVSGRLTWDELENIEQSIGRQEKETAKAWAERVLPYAKKLGIDGANYPPKKLAEAIGQVILSHRADIKHKADEIGDTKSPEAFSADPEARSIEDVATEALKSVVQNVETKLLLQRESLKRQSIFDKALRALEDDDRTGKEVAWIKNAISMPMVPDVLMVRGFEHLEDVWRSGKGRQQSNLQKLRPKYLAAIGRILSEKPEKKDEILRHDDPVELVGLVRANLLSEKELLTLKAKAEVNQNRELLVEILKHQVEQAKDEVARRELYLELISAQRAETLGRNEVLHPGQPYNQVATLRESFEAQATGMPARGVKPAQSQERSKIQTKPDRRAKIREQRKGQVVAEAKPDTKSRIESTDPAVAKKFRAWNDLLVRVGKALAKGKPEAIKGAIEAKAIFLADLSRDSLQPADQVLYDELLTQDQALNAQYEHRLAAAQMGDQSQAGESARSRSKIIEHSRDLNKLLEIVQTGNPTNEELQVLRMRAARGSQPELLKQVLSEEIRRIASELATTKNKKRALELREVRDELTQRLRDLNGGKSPENGDNGDLASLSAGPLRELRDRAAVEKDFKRLAEIIKQRIAMNRRAIGETRHQGTIRELELDIVALEEELQIVQTGQIPQSYLKADQGSAPEPKNPSFVDPDDLVFKATQITLARLPKYLMLHADNEQASDEKFKQLTRELWREFAVHGAVKVDSATGKVIIRRETDLDGTVALGLLALAGLKNIGVEYVPAGESRPGKINIDTGNKDGLVVEDDGRTAYLDHHTPESGRDNSGSKIAYETMVRLGLLERTAELDKLVEFVTKFDNLKYPADEYGPKSARTMLGLRKDLSFANLVLLFKQGKDATTELSDADMKAIIVKPGYKRKDKFVRAETLLDKSQRRLTDTESAQGQLREMEQQGLIFESADYGRIVVDIDGKLNTGVDAAKASGAGMYVLWMPKTKSFFLSSLSETPLRHQFDQGEQIRDTMWIKPRTDKDPLTLKLADVLKAVSNGELEPTGELKKYLAKESELTPSLTPQVVEALETREVELQLMAETMLDLELEAELDSLGYQPDEKEEEKNSKSYKRLRQEQLVKIMARFSQQS